MAEFRQSTGLLVFWETRRVRWVDTPMEEQFDALIFMT